MQASLQSVRTPRQPATAVEEQPYPSWPGAVVAGSVIVAYIVGIVLIIVHNPVTVGIGVALLVVGSVAVGGLTAVKPGEVRVIQLFGGYRGTVRTTGLRWVNPFSVRLRVSVRIRNKETPTVKVNDADGNPIEIAAVVVWQVRDSAQATYSVENVVTFVDTQSETALRHVANSHSYDASGEGIMSLRDHTDEVGGQVAAGTGGAGRARGRGDHRVQDHPAVLRPGDRPGDAAATAGQRRRGRPDTDRGGRRGDGADGPVPPRR